MASSIKRRGKKGIFWYYGNYNGKEIRESLHTQIKQVAEREQRARDAKYQEHNFLVKSKKNPTVEEFWKLAEANDSEHCRPNTVATKKYFWDLLVAYTGAKRLGEITQREIEGFKKHLTKDAKDEEALRRRKQTANNALKDISALYTFAISKGHFTGINPVVGVPRYRLLRKMPEFHTEEERDRLIEEAAKIGRPIEWVVLLGCHAGLRKCEILAARWEWLDFDQRMIHIKGYPGFSIKDFEERSLPMHSRIYEAMNPFRKNEGYVFGNGQPGKHYYHYDCKRSLVSALEKAGLPTAKPFQRLRETFVSLHCQNGKNVFKVSKWVGHASVKTTERHYASLGNGYDPDIE